MRRSAEHLDPSGTALSAGNRQSAVSPLRESALSASHEALPLGNGLDIEEGGREHGILADILLDQLAAPGGILDTGEWQRVLQGITETLASRARQHDEELHCQTSRQVAFITHELRNSLDERARATVAQTTDAERFAAFSLLVSVFGRPAPFKARSQWRPAFTRQTTEVANRMTV